MGLVYLHHFTLKQLESKFTSVLSHFENGCDVTAYFMLGRTEKRAIISSRENMSGYKKVWLKCWHAWREKL